MQDLPGEELFQYVEADGSVRHVESADVNGYLKSIAGEGFTSKDFRTWAGTVLCTRALRSLSTPRSAAETRRTVVQAVESVARKLGNTKAVCRKCYIHPAVIESFERGELHERVRGRSDEAGVLAVLRAGMRRDAVQARRSGAGGRSLAPVLARSLERLQRQRAAPA
jgi:DNA topoisomerase-1